MLVRPSTRLRGAVISAPLTPASNPALKAPALNHEVLIRVKDDAKPADVQKMLEGAAELHYIKGVRAVSFTEIPQNLYEGYPNRAKGYTHKLQVILASPGVQSLQEYDTHPIHVKFRKDLIVPVLADALAVDTLLTPGESEMFHANPYKIPFTNLAPFDKGVSYGKALEGEEEKTKLFQPLKIRGLTLKNRLAVSPMCQYSAYDGFANDYHLQEVGSWAVGGFGLVIMEATGVVPEGRITPHCTGIWRDDQIPVFRRLVEFCHAHGTSIGIQIGHAGRKSSHPSPFFHGGREHGAPVEQGGWPEEVFGPSALPWSSTFFTPKELSKQEIKDTLQAFAAAAKRANAAGFDVLEIHGAHGYLISSFLSPLSNTRTDEYGGSRENRMRLAVEVAAAVRTEWPADKPLFFRVSFTDWVDGGVEVEDTVALARALEKVGVDLMDCSSGGNHEHQMGRMMKSIGPGFQVPFAAAVKQETKVSSGAVGLITEAAQAEQILQKGEADLIFFGRAALREPYFPLRASRDLNVAVQFPTQHHRAYPAPLKAKL